jgi:hypothetical protein
VKRGLSITLFFLLSVFYQCVSASDCVDGKSSVVDDRTLDISGRYSLKVCRIDDEDTIFSGKHWYSFLSHFSSDPQFSQIALSALRTPDDPHEMTFLDLIKPLENEPATMEMRGHSKLQMEYLADKYEEWTGVTSRKYNLKESLKGNKTDFEKLKNTVKENESNLCNLNSQDCTKRSHLKSLKMSFTDGFVQEVLPLNINTDAQGCQQITYMVPHSNLTFSSANPIEARKFCSVTGSPDIEFFTPNNEKYFINAEEGFKVRSNFSTRGGELVNNCDAFVVLEDIMSTYCSPPPCRQEQFKHSKFSVKIKLAHQSDLFKNHKPIVPISHNLVLVESSQDEIVGKRPCYQFVKCTF